MANLSNINNKFIVNDGGNILIGTTADVATVRLHVKNSSAAAVLRLTGGSDSWDFDTDYTANKLLIKSSGAAGTVMTLLGASGNVGIGTVSPDSKLEVSADVAKGILINRTFTTSSQTLANVRAYYGLAITPLRGGTGGLYFTNYDADTPIIQSVNTSDVAQFLLLNPLGGNVGIGTTSPITKLSNTAIRNSAASGLSTSLAGLNWEVPAGANSQGYIASFANTQTAAANANAGVLIEVGSTDTTTRLLSVESGGVNRFEVRGDGNVGIGTVSPRADAFTIGLTIGNTTTGGAQLVLEENTLAGGWRIFNNGYLGFIANNDERMRIDSSGNMSIKQQTFVDSVNTNYDITMPNGIAFGGAAYTYCNIFGSGGNMTIAANAYPANSGNVSTITFKTASVGGGTFVPMVISGDNVGIGTDAPTEKLEVKGNIVLNGQSTATGTTELDSLIFRKSHPSGASSGYYNQGLIKGVTYGGYAGGMNFYYNRSNNDGSGSYTNTQALWLNQYGNFCIGENSSSYKLRVKSGTIANNSVSNGVYISAGTSSSSHTLYAENQDGSAEFFAVRGDGEIRLNASSGHTYAAQGIRFGANATANNLDDYEEGTWTPVAYASSGTATGSYSAQLGTYTKTGRQVICMFDITLILSGTMVGFAGISGLPFTVGTTSATGGGMAGYSVNQFRSSSLFAVAGAGRQISGFPQQNASYIYCQVDNSGVNGFGSAAYATWNIGTTGRCTGYVIYFTN